MSDFDYDLFVIGAGSGGVRAARMAAQRGARVAVAESGELGGTCVNLGCIPKKLYSFAAHYGEAFEESKGYGWIGTPPVLDWEKLKANRGGEVRRLNGIYEGLLLGNQVTVIRGHAAIASPHEVTVDGITHRAAHILIATGSHPLHPAVPGGEHAVSSDDMFDLKVFPKRLVVVGAGYIACEMASIFHGLGAHVTQVVRGERLLRGFDDEIAAHLKAEVVKRGIDLRLATRIRHIEKTAEGLQITFHDDQTLVTDVLLHATGRGPNTRGLGLHDVGVKLGEQGEILVDEQYLTNIPSISAVGDVTNRVQLTPVALAEAMAVVDRLYGTGERRVDYEFIPTAVFTHPNIGTVGWTEVDARRHFGAVRVYKSEFRSLLHTLSGSNERTFMKLVVEDATDRVVGLHMVGAEAGDIVQGFAVAMKAGATKAVFDATIGIHPTVAEEFVTMREPSK